MLPNEAAMNVMSVSLQRLTDGRIALLYLRKEAVTDCRPYLRYSGDEARTWSQPVKVIPDEDSAYYVVNNDRVIQLKTGRLVIPAALHEVQHDPPAFSPYGRALCYVSDDGGRTWQRGREARVRPRTDGVPVMVQEPGIIELRDGRLMMFCRTDAGSQYVAWSRDGGMSWSELGGSEIISPLSPASMKRIPSTGDLLLIWNNHAAVSEALANKRTLLTVALSNDEGQHWRRVRNLEANPHGWYCYTAVAFTPDHVLLAYCAGATGERTTDSPPCRSLAFPWPGFMKAARTARASRPTSQATRHVGQRSSGPAGHSSFRRLPAGQGRRQTSRPFPARPARRESSPQSRGPGA